jgi:hypothetical protein
MCRCGLTRTVAVKLGKGLNEAYHRLVMSNNVKRIIVNAGKILVACCQNEW